jgi:hypothetical protein
VTTKAIDQGRDREAPGASRSAASKDCEEHRENLLDEALEETFPASDPPSIAKPAGKGC